MDRALQVLVVSPVFPSRAAPASGTFVRSQAGALHALGVKLEVVAPLPWVPPPLRGVGRWGAYHDAATEEIAEPYPVARPTYPRPPGAWMQPRVGRRIAARLDAKTFEKPDAVLAHALLPTGEAARLHARAAGCPYVVITHGSDVLVDPLRSARHREACQRVCREASAVVSVSRSLSQAVEELSGVQAEVIHNGVDVELFRPTSRQAAREELGLPAQEPVVLFVGLDVERKGLADLLDAWEKVRSTHPKARLAVVGPRRSELASFELGDATVPGPCTQDRLALWYAASTVTVLPSRQEAFGCTLVEAGACARPVIATRTGGMVEIVKEAETGWLVEVGHSDQIAAAIDRVLSDPESSKELGLRGRQHVLENFTWQANAEATLEILRRAVRSSASAQPEDSS